MTSRNLGRPLIFHVLMTKPSSVGAAVSLLERFSASQSWYSVLSFQRVGQQAQPFPGGHYGFSIAVDLTVFFFLPEPTLIPWVAAVSAALRGPSKLPWLGVWLSALQDTHIYLELVHCQKVQLLHQRAVPSSPGARRFHYLSRHIRLCPVLLSLTCLCHQGLMMPKQHDSCIEGAVAKIRRKLFSPFCHIPLEGPEAMLQWAELLQNMLSIFFSQPFLFQRSNFKWQPPCCIHHR